MNRLFSIKLVCLALLIIALTPGSTFAKKKKGLSDEEALKKLPEKWHDVKPIRLFPDDLKLKLTGIADSGKGEKYDFNEPISEDVKKKLISLGKDSMIFHYYFAPRTPRYKDGPGLSGHEFLKEVKNNTARDDVKQVAWIYGEFKKNMDASFWLYRVTEDPWFLEDIVCWAEVNQKLLDTGSKLFIPPGGRETKTFNKETDISIQHLYGHFLAARLLTEKAVKEGGNAKDPNFINGKKWFDLAWSQIEKHMIGPLPEFGKAKKGQPQPKYTLGPNVKYIMDNFQLPGSMAHKIEYMTWNGQIERNISLLHAGCAAEMIYKVTKDEEYNKLSLLFENYFKATMHMFQKSNHCVVDKDGTPYIWVHHTASRDGDPNKNLPKWRGHPIFNAEDNGHGTSMARCLPIIWEAGPRFGCSTALLAAYTNTMADMCINPTAINKDGKPHYNNRLKNPWTRAKMGTAAGKKAPFFSYVWSMAFSPEFLPGIRKHKDPFTGLSKDKRPKENIFGLQVEVSRYLYQKWKKEQNKLGGS